MIKIPNQIKKCDLSDNPFDFDWFVYRWVNLKNGMPYTGLHGPAKPFEDGYFQSGESKELKLEFADPNSEWEYKIMGYYPTKKSAAFNESAILREDKKNGIRTYNMTVGSAKKAKDNMDKVYKLHEKIENSEFEVHNGFKTDFDDIDRMQVRFEEIKQDIQDIKNSINDRGGDTSLTNPLILCTRDGKRVLLDGNHTMMGIKKSKHAVKYTYIDLGDLTDWTKPEIENLASLFNKPNEVRKSANTSKDYVKRVVTWCTDSNITPHDLDIKTFLITNGLNSDEIGKIIKKSSEKLEEAEWKKMYGLKWKTYTKNSPDVKIAMNQYTDENSSAIFMSSAAFRLDRILEQAWDSHDAFDKKFITVIIHHPAMKHEEKWDSKDHSEKYNYCKVFLNQFGIRHKFIILPTTESDYTIAK